MSVDRLNLRDIHLFQLLDDEELAELGSHIDEMVFKPQQTVYKAGDLGSDMHIVMYGKVQVYVTDEDGNQVVVGEVEPGEMFGEMSLLDNEPHTATAIAVAPTKTFIIDRDDLKRLFTKKPDAALDIIAILGQRIRKTDVLLSHRVAKNVNAIIEREETLGERVADRVAAFGGSWNFIGLFAAVLLTWVFINGIVLHDHAYDPYPFILLNLILSMLAAIQAPVIMMSQNRQDAKDRVRSEQDYKVNLKAEVEILQLHQKVDQLRDELSRIGASVSSQAK